MLSKIKVVFILFIISVLSSCTFIRLIQNGVIDEELELKTGTTLAVYGDMAVIGTNAYGAWGGYVLILRCLNGKWKEEAVFEMEKIAYGFRGPCALSASENYIAIGLDNKKNKPGAVIILYRNSNGKWEPGQKLYGKQKQPDDLFGMSVSLCNNKLAVGAPGNERTYLYRLDERECILEQILAPDSFAGDSKFGNYVSLNDDMLYVGQCGFKSLSSKNMGKCCLYRYNSDEKKFLSYFEIFPPIDREKYFHFADSFSVCEKGIIISDGYEKLYYFNEDDEQLYQLYSSDENLFYHWRDSDYGFSFSGNLFCIENEIFLLSDNNLIKKIQFKIEEISDECRISKISSMNENIFIGTDIFYCDNYKKRKEQLLYGKNHGNPYPKLEEERNSGCVYIIRIMPDFTYNIEACIARKTVKEKGREKVVFYDKLQETR